MNPRHSQRHTIHQVKARILHHQAHEGQQYILHVHAPEIAERAEPGSFVHLQVDPQRPLRRPISIMRADPGQGTGGVSLQGLWRRHDRLLAPRKVGEKLVPSRADRHALQSPTWRARAPY
jgi:dihydroorotate dehydrogenase electron transfer subunit